MAFLESPRFPDKIAFGAVVGPVYSTVVTTATGGAESRVITWSQARNRYDVGRRVMNQSDTDALYAFFRSVKGRGHGFRLKDWTDYTVTAANGALVTTSAAGVFQLAKQYIAGTLSEARNIRKPVAGTAVLYRNGTPISAGAGAGQYALDTTTGLATFVADSSASISAIALGSATQVTLSSALAGVAVGGLLSLSGLSGADAGVLNGQSFTVSGVAGAVYTLAVSTVGKIITSSGTGSKYPQPSDVLAWSGQFDVPVRFDTDDMKMQIVDRNGPSGDLLVDWGSIQLIEIRT
ncbi:DUF2460 domain-containing protein [Cupriavidus sp. BIC8F]|uniref:DUF2460 domain-containing protein n=1 Tax=Cupriavidus sp. BIC8F TaxID=3079014 RepID=UPI002916E7BE|nr:DUF2460 domain-containing protein [Cupriavidus sp. BIC8F]